MALEVPSWFSKTCSDFGAAGSSVSWAVNDVGNSKAENFEDCRNDVVFSVSSAENDFGNSKTEEFDKSMHDVCTKRISFEISSWLFGNNINSGDLDKTRNDLVGEEKQVSGEHDYVGGVDDFCPFSDSDFEALQAEIFVEDNADPFFRGNWKEGEDFMVYFLGSNNDMEVVSMLLEVCNFLDMLNVDPDAMEDVIKQQTQCFLDMHEKVRKGNVYLMNATFVKLQLIAGLKYYRHFKHMCRIEYETVLSNPNLCYENHELANLIGFLYDKEPEPASLDYEGSNSASWKACKYLAGFQGPKMLETDGGLSIFLEGSSASQSKDACTKPGNSLSREMKTSRDPWQECSARMLYDTVHIITHAVSENSSTSTAHYGEEPSEARFFALAYLSLPDLLAVERVCKSLRDKVRNDPLLWRHIHVDNPLCRGLTDDALLNLAKRSQGLLQHLSLVQCLQITHDGLKQVLAISPKLTELCLPYCLNFTGEGIVNIVEAHKEFSFPGLKLLKINGICNVTSDHVEKLKYLMDGGSQKRSQVVKPHFYPYGHHYSDDDCLIDVEECPKCGKARLVYDCTLESCQGKGCRGCIFCISRCRKCGRCIDALHDDYEETMPIYDLLCADCSLCCQIRRAVEPWLLHP
ncbi:uncharacterized protein LOC131055854 [Cryptomeria japonica]|uniref:uncharacterized protein LOC131055854 n=1 Tax=Cryptomeria japonica TaxID=3369 RepID=UPI0027DA7CA2|nr:uncharacterized protein LOC131055854 [Cryptomeria japonica]